MVHIRHIRIVMAVLAVVFIMGSFSTPAAADTISVTQELRVTAQVLPMRRIIVDPAGRIIKITSNTTEDVTPEVYLLRDSPANRQPLTDTIYEQYRDHVLAGSGRSGLLYERSAQVRSLEFNTVKMMLSNNKP